MKCWAIKPIASHFLPSHLQFKLDAEFGIFKMLNSELDACGELGIRSQVLEGEVFDRIAKMA